MVYALSNRRQRMSGVALVTLIFALIVVFKADKLNELPIWDAAGGVFPAAFYLDETGFDFPNLLRQPTFASGGPNTHSLSPVTIVTAVGASLFGDGPNLFPILHLIHMALAALAVYEVYRFAKPGLGLVISLLLAITFFLFPLTRVQAGYMYLEIPLVLATVLAVRFWVENRPKAAGLWAALAVLIKPTGIIVAGALAGAALLSTNPEHRTRVVRYTLLPATFALNLSMLPIFLPRSPTVVESVDSGANSVASHASSSFGSITVSGWRANWDWLANVPDLAVLIAIALLVAGFSAGSLWRAARSGPSEDSATAHENIGNRAAISTLMLAVFFAVYAITPVAVSITLLPRYYVQMIPFVLYLVTAGMRRIGGSTAAVFTLIGLSAFFLVNANGTFYPNNDLNIMPLIERSESYEHLHATQMQAIAAAAEIAPSRQIFYQVLDHYRMTIPRLGYVDEAVKNGTLVRGPTRWNDLDNYPDRFALLPEWDGGSRTLIQVWEQAAEDPRWDVEVVSFQEGSFTTRLILVDRITNSP